ncbi:LEF-2 [Dione juno nucleopolyhedrovirus]|uniref:LEF-2 n=1 Tax=Dione juno nucleopolyhedrovirus TaxID=2594175 RepID=A0AAE6H3A2_9ABAC|nr:LEF-2 [Dione juno nucleopolyhedrovirus]QDL57003.1 LEF-2 [Dione juno nucleopolyhedrovirus]
MESVWSPAAGTSSLKRAQTYLIDPDDFVGVLTLSPYTVFERGLFVRMSGMRLLALMAAAAESKPQELSAARRFPQRSKRNVCLKACADGSVSLAKALATRVTLPPCMVKIMSDLEIAARGNMYRKRFEFNCYLANVITCTKCKTACLIGALLHFYQMDSKCVGEVTHLLIKSENAYKPSNCAKMKTVTKLCPVKDQCRGKNPICNY